ncbi:MAG: XRE family transcriptional regulator [Betaproteobacteria bacterium]|nr:XRE family transcriptional regulator [Betaproteobacteria bacterium]
MKRKRKKSRAGSSRGPAALRAALDERKWTQLKVATMLGVSRATVSRWLSGERVPDREHMASLREVLDISPDVWV